MFYYMALNEKQELFCQYYIQLLHATHAYMKAYDTNYQSGAANSSRLLKTDKIRSRIQELLKERKDRLKFESDYVVSQLVEIVNRCMQHKPIYEFNAKSKKLEKTGEFKFDSYGANKALELLGNHLGMFKEKHDININTVPIIKDIDNDD